jgi:hypothetical protein
VTRAITGYPGHPGHDRQRKLETARDDRIRIYGEPRRAIASAAQEWLGQEAA